VYTRTMPTESTTDISILRQCVLFEGLELNDLRVIASSARLRRVKSGSMFFYQDQPATTLYVLVEGRVKFTQVTPEGEQVLLRAIGPGEMFGAVAALGDAVHPATAQAVGDCIALGWRSEEISDLMERFPRIAVNALRFMAGRLKEFQDRYREMATERAERRVAHALLRLAGQIGREVEGGTLIDLPLSRQDIAEMAGTTLFTVSRILRGWQERGLVRTGRERVVICGLEGLEVVAEGIEVEDGV
jgi:CRP/FNR family transcriptional regulator, nitrogen oxide reductase regulator